MSNPTCNHLVSTYEHDTFNPYGFAYQMMVAIRSKPNNRRGLSIRIRNVRTEVCTNKAEEYYNVSDGNEDRGCRLGNVHSHYRHLSQILNT